VDKSFSPSAAACGEGTRASHSCVWQGLFVWLSPLLKQMQDMAMSGCRRRSAKADIKRVYFLLLEIEVPHRFSLYLL
jgi:hypothetical protein